MEYGFVVTYSVLHGGSWFVADVEYPPHFHIDRNIRQYVSKGRQPQSQLHGCVCVCDVFREKTVLNNIQKGFYYTIKKDMT